MKVILKRPGQAFEVGELNGIDEIWNYLGGAMETVPFKGYKYRVVCNDEFLYNGSEPNIRIDGVDYYGNIFICSTGENEHGEWDLIGMTDEDLKEFTFLLITNSLS
ncbi:MAG: DUF3846 domain-containing protein [Oscillospiraceae bacterium]|nr:DUF3846 domain-containing protein [Oscillospiraceae bacterium]